MFFNEDQFKVIKVRTVDGTTPVFTEKGVPVTKTVWLPANRDTKKLLEEENSRKPNHLKMKIEFVKAYTPAPVPNEPRADMSALEKRILELEAENKKLQDQKVLVSENGSQPNGISKDESENKNLPKEKVKS